MKIAGIIVCQGERFRVVETGELERWTDSGWQFLGNVLADGLRVCEGDLVPVDIKHALIFAGRQLHYLYGWRISEVNAYTTAEDMVETDGGSSEIENAPAFQDASVNFVKEQVDN